MIFTPLERRSSLSSPSRWLRDALGGERTTSGETVTARNALQIGAVSACVRVISEAVASLPLIVYKEAGRGKARASSHPVYRLLHDEPNPEMTSCLFFETLQQHIEIWGNAYAMIVRGSRSGTAKELWPLMPDKVEVVRLGSDGRMSMDGKIAYRYRVGNGHGDVFLSDADVLHVPGMSFDGLVGYSPIHQFRETLGVTKAAEKYAAGYYGNSATPLLALEYPSALTPEAAALIRNSWNKRHRGSSNSSGMVILEEGTTVKQLSIPPEQSQFLETRQFAVEEIARIFNVPPHKIGHLERSTFSNIEEQNMEFVQDTIRPKLVRWEKEINRKLLRGSGVFAEFLIEGALRADIAKRYAAYAVGRQWGYLSADDVREKENLNPLPDGQGDIYLVPANMMDASAVPSEPEGQPPPDTDAKADPEADEQDDADVRSMAKEVVEAHRTTVLGSLRRVLKIEQDRVRSFIRNGGDVQGAIDGFYESHSEVVQDALIGPLSAAYLSAVRAAGWRGDAAELSVVDAVRSLGRRHCDQSIRMVPDLTDQDAVKINGPGRLSDEVDQVLDAILEAVWSKFDAKQN